MQSNQKIESGYAVMTDTATTLDTIVEQIEEVAREVQEIARATQELSTGSEGIAGSSQEQASSARAISEAADSLAELTRELRGSSNHKEYEKARGAQPMRLGSLSDRRRRDEACMIEN